MPDLTLDSALLQQHGTPTPLDVMNGSSHAGNNTEMEFEEIISAEFLVSLRTSTHVPGFAVIKRALCGRAKLDRMLIRYYHFIFRIHLLEGTELAVLVFFSRGEM